MRFIHARLDEGWSSTADGEERDTRGRVLAVQVGPWVVEVWVTRRVK